MKIIRKLLLGLALVCLLMGIILVGVSMVTGSGFDRVVAHGVVGPYLEMEGNFIMDLLWQSADFVESFIVTGFEILG